MTKLLHILTIGALTLTGISTACAESLKGTVIESMDSGGYTYVKFKTEDGREHWAATTPVSIKPGEAVSVSTGMEMRDFNSPTLNRTFETIYFVGSVKAGGMNAPALSEMPAEMPEGHPSIPGMSGMPAGHPDIGGMPAGHPDISGMQGSSSADDGAVLKGRIVSFQDVDRYTYLEIVTDTGDEAWAAIATENVKEGQWIKLLNSSPMEDFHSESLDKTFDLIHFSADYEIYTAEPGAPSPGTASSEPVSTEGAVTIEDLGEVAAQKEALAGKRVAVTGTVTKFNAGILGRNWAHISNEDGSSDLTLTLDGTVEVGQSIKAVGVLGTDRDFGAGYTYSVLLEDCQVQAL